MAAPNEKMNNWRLEIGSSAQRDIKRLGTAAENEIDRHFAVINSNPFTGEPLHGVLHGFWKYPFNLRRTSYRIVYQILKDEKVILIIMVGSRESFYKRLRKRLN